MVGADRPSWWAGSASISPDRAVCAGRHVAVGAEYVEYKRNVPAWWPRLHAWTPCMS